MQLAAADSLVFIFPKCLGRNNDDKCSNEVVSRCDILSFAAESHVQLQAVSSFTKYVCLCEH